MTSQTTSFNPVSMSEVTASATSLNAAGDLITPSNHLKFAQVSESQSNAYEILYYAEH